MAARKLISFDEAVIARCQSAADEAWDAYGIAVGDAICALAVANGVILFSLNLPDHKAIPVVITLFALFFSSAHSWAQRSGQHEMINGFSEIQRQGFLYVRLFFNVFLRAMIVAFMFQRASLHVLASASFLPLMLYAVTVKVRPRAPRHHPAMAGQR